MRRAVLLIPLALLALAGCKSDPATDQTFRDFMAYDACTDAVSQQLKAPGSADFQSKLDVDYRTSGGNNITIIGYVDAENSFGAKLRTDWMCSADVDSQGQATNLQASVADG